MGENYVSKVKELREAKGMTQRQLADFVGVDTSTIRNWESGRSGIDWIVRVIRLCEALESAPADLVSEGKGVEE